MKKDRTIEHDNAFRLLKTRSLPLASAARRLFFVGVLACLSYSNIFAATTPFVDSAFYSKYPYIRFVGSDEDNAISDDTFYAIAAKIGFAVNKTEPAAGNQYLEELENLVLPRINQDSLELAFMMVRGAASPDGPYDKNKVLGEKRAQWLFDFLRQHLRFPVNEKTFHLDSEAEDYHTLCILMQQASDKDYGKVKSLCDTYLPNGDIASLKSALKGAQGGQLWKRLNKDYFNQLRTARVVLYFKKYEGELMDVAKIEDKPIVEETPKMPVIEVMPELVVETPPQPVADTLTKPVWEPRREVLSVKTNLLFYGIYMPGYNRWCPIPNIAIEYYPKKGHFTYGASFDMPWWQDYDAHKYFQLRNYQVEARYYLKPNNAQETHEAHKTHKLYEKPRYTGYYLQGYVNGGIFGICFDADRGWVGEGIGGGVGFGYVTPISRNGHWRLDFGLQVGFFRCKYDPYQYENPVDPSYHDDLYYYKWTLEPSAFKKRQYRWNWIGPTRIGITLSYDLLYKRIHKKGVSFKDYEIYEAYGPNEERRAAE